MSDDEDKKIVETNNESQNDSETNSDLQPEIGNTSSDSNRNRENQQRDENNQENKVIHKKEGRLHIYVRQDKYKGELKSKNWVGRLYVNGKQKISSSGTQNLEEAIPILEKWFDDILLEAQSIQQQNEQKTQEKETKSEVITQKVENLEEPKKDEPKTKKVAVLDKIKGISLFQKKGDSKKGVDAKKQAKDFFNKFFKSKVSKLSVAGEEIAGLDITKEGIRVCQVSQDKEEKWILDKFSYRLFDQEKINENLFESKDYITEEINLALANAKITSKNIAMSIPVTSAIIRVVTSPLMSDEELQKAIETDSLWENLVQLADNLNDYSVFHQVINRDSKKNTMDILFVASKLADVNAYSNLAKKAGLNPVIVDVRCFTLKNAHDNCKFKSLTDQGGSALLELSSDENYLMIIHNNIPVITDVFLRQPEKDLLKNFSSANASSSENEAVIRRYSMQLKQALTDYEAKYDQKISNIQIVSSLKNVKDIMPLFKRNLQTVGFYLFNPLEGIQVPSYNVEKTNIENRSPIAPVLGLGYRKLDVFGYYKFVTAVKNINLLPNRDAIRQQGRLKFLSGFAAKGLAGAIAGIYLLLIVVSFFQISSNKEKLLQFDQVQSEFNIINVKHTKLMKQKNEMQRSMELGKLVNSNQTRSYRALAQITRSVPLRVNFSKLTFDGNDNVVIEGMAFSDQDILNFISNLNGKELIEQASLAAMKVDSQENTSGSNNKKGFVINCKLKIGT